MSEERIRELYGKLKREAEESGYRLNPDTEFTMDLVEGLLVNRERYGYMSCPCRLASGTKAEDLDIICPCDYRDPDLDDYGCCFCALYVSEEISRGEAEPHSIPDRRGSEEKEELTVQAGGLSLSLPVWRCNVCGYLCAREQPPGICPVCKAERDRFSRFI